MVYLIFALLLTVVLFLPWGYGFFALIRDIWRKCKQQKERNT